jgi:hypothetical protein
LGLTVSSRNPAGALDRLLGESLERPDARRVAAVDNLEET